jgi:hypothetical protein
LNVKIKPSTNKNKKIDVYKNNVKIASIGNKNYLDYPKYIKEKGLDYANKRRFLYHLRHKKNNGITCAPIEWVMPPRWAPRTVRTLWLWCTTVASAA